MEPMDVKADLQALRKLYGLLQSSGDNERKSENEIFVGTQLDERARLMLKNLLDVAADKTLETHSKIVAEAESRVSNSSCYIKAKQSNVIPKLRSPVSPYIFKSSPMVGMRNSNYNLTCRKDEFSGAKPMTQEVTLESSKASISSNRRKRCRICQQRSMEPQSNDVTQGDGRRVNGNMEKKGSELVKSNVASLKQKCIYEVERSPSACSSSLLATGQIKNKPEVLLRNDFSREIARSIRRIDSGISKLSLEPTEVSNNVRLPNQIPKRMAKKSKLVTKLPARNMKAEDMCMEASLPPATSQHVPPSNADVAKQPPRPMQPLHRMAHRKVVKSRPLMSPLQVIVRPTLIDAEKSRTSRMRKTQLARHQQESEKTSSSSSSPSPSPSSSSSSSSSSSRSWTNRQSSTYSSDTDESNSFPSSTRGIPSSRGFASMASNSTTSVSDQSNSSSSPYRSYHHQNPDKAIGRMRRIKNKLGLIFHHHHHHHHHHHYDNQSSDDDTNHLKVSRNKRSTWKHLHNIFHHENRKHKDDIFHHENRNQKDDRLRKLQPREPQAKHFHKLVGGLRRQVGHSKMSKPSIGIGGLSNGRKKLHWWQMLKRHGGVKVGKKGRLKLGVQTRKQIKNLDRR